MSNFLLLFLLQIISGLSQIEDNCIGKIKGIPSSSEKFIMIQFRHFEFKDMMGFCPGSLDNLVQDLCRRNGNFDILKNSIMMKVNGKFSNERFNLATRKLAYPYEYVTNGEILKETKLPTKSKFYSSLKQQDVTQDEYDHAVMFWETFGCNTMAGFSMKYCHLDSLLAACVFFEMRDFFYEWGGLDAPRYLGLPGLAQDLFLKQTKVKVKLMTDKKMVDLVGNEKTYKNAT